MVKVTKPILAITERHRNELKYLWDYLNISGEERQNELARWALDAGQFDFDEEICDELLSNPDDPRWKDLEAEVNEHEIGRDQDAPSFVFMIPERILHNVWLVHKTNHASDVLRHGFGGTGDMDRLGYTYGATKRLSGYNFAFQLGKEKEEAYGKEAIVFQASGVQVWHAGDDENQVIFWGPDAKNAAHIWKYEGFYGIGSEEHPIFKSEHLRDVAEWWARNHRQYKKFGK